MAKVIKISKWIIIFIILPVSSALAIFIIRKFFPKTSKNILKNVNKAYETTKKYVMKPIEYTSNLVTSASNTLKLNNLHYQYKGNFKNLVNAWQNAGFTVIITSAYRSYAEQKALDDKDDKNAEPGRSHHNYGLAIDVNLVKNGKQLKKASAVKDWVDSGAIKIATDMGFKWGNYSTYKDLVHFYIDIPIITLQSNPLYTQHAKNNKLNQLPIA